MSIENVASNKKNAFVRRDDTLRALGRDRLSAVVGTVFRWLGYGCDQKGLDRVAPVEGLGWAPHLALASGVALIGAAAASGLSLAGDGWGVALFWVSFAIIVVPSALRLTWPDASRAERIWLLNILGLTLFITRGLSTPTGFYGHDEYLHWSTAIDILERHRLFTTNSLLPVSPAYPGLEIVVSALVQLTGLSVFHCALLLVGALRIMLVSSLFLIFEKISNSSWVGALATLVYMVSSNFYTFLAAFAYETIAIDFLFVGIFLAVLVATEHSIERRRIVVISVPIFFALAASHHLTSWTGVVFLSGAAVSGFFRGDRKAALATAAILGVAILSIVLWKSISGSAVNAYVGDIFGKAIDGFLRFLSGASPGRVLFKSANGQSEPIAYQVAAILSVVLISGGLVVGFFRSLGLSRQDDSPSAPILAAGRKALFLGMRDNPWAITLTVSSFAFPPSILLRLTSGGWELGNRMAAFVFLGVGLVVAVGAAKALIGPHPSRARTTVLGLCLSVMLTGGLIAELPPDLVASRYRPAADGTSIEPMGIAAAKWTRRWLGEGWRFASDRVNRLLLATYGVQRIVTKEEDGVELGHVTFDQAYFGEQKKTYRLSDEDMNSVRVSDVDFLLVDLRLQNSRPLFGYYFDAGEDGDLGKSSPLGIDLEKFDHFPRVGRIFDNGYEVIYDVRNLVERPPWNEAPSLGAGGGRVDRAADVARTFPQGGRLHFDVATPGLPATGEPDAPMNGPKQSATFNYDSGVMRHVTR